MEIGLEGSTAGYAHNMGAEGYRSYLDGDHNDDRIPSRSVGFQNAIAAALGGEIIPFHDFFWNNSQICGGASCIGETINDE